jgi:hypothetical protein
MVSVVTLLMVWFLAAVGIGASGVFESATPVHVAGTVWGATAAVLLLCWKYAPARSLALTSPIWAVLSLHIVRMVGVVFLAMFFRGDLPFSVGVAGGIGDILAALGAIALVWQPVPPRSWIAAWNVFGLTDIVGVVISVFQAGLRDPAVVAHIRQFPLSLLPTYFVPLIIASHVILFARLRARVMEPAM